MSMYGQWSCFRTRIISIPVHHSLERQCLFNVQFTTDDVHWWTCNMLPCWNRSAFKKMNGLNGCKWSEKKQKQSLIGIYVHEDDLSCSIVCLSLSIYIHSSAPIVLVALPVIKWPTNCSVPVQTYARTCTCPIRTKQLEAKSLDSSIDSNEWIEYIYILPTKHQLKYILTINWHMTQWNIGTIWDKLIMFLIAVGNKPGSNTSLIANIPFWSAFFCAYCLLFILVTICRSSNS